MIGTRTAYDTYADSSDEMKEVIRKAGSNYQSAEQWRVYAKELEVALNEISEKYAKMTDIYIETAGFAQGQAILKEKVIKEIARLDPTNKLLDFEYRKQILEKAKSEKVRELKMK